MAAHQTRQTRQNESTAAAAAATAAAEAHRVRRAALTTLDCLHDIPPAELDRLADAGVLRAFAAGSTIISERRLGDFLFLLLRGTVRVTLHDRDGREILLGVLDRGDCCGEGPLFGDIFRRATVYAERHCNLLQLPIAAVREMLPDAPHLTARLRHIYRQRLAQTTLGRVPLFNHLSQVDRTAIGALLRPTHHQRGAAIVQEGTPGSTLYLIESGQVVIEQRGQPIAHMHDGDFFGEMSLLDNKPHNATVRALTPTTVLELPDADLGALLERNAALSERLRSVVEARRVAGASMLGDRDRTRQLTVAVQNGLLRGTHVLVRTPELCPVGCRLCESGCETRHGQTRLHLNGVALGKLDVLNACRQCRVSPECVEACPENAIAWDDRGALIVNDKCTGCGKCVEACPYDAIEQQPLAQQGMNGPMWQLWAAFKQLRQPTIALEAVHHTQRASKCDLCHGHDNMACLSACPTGSLRLVPVEELFPL